jgi:hypothetical protein
LLVAKHAKLAQLLAIKLVLQGLLPERLILLRELLLRLALQHHALAHFLGDLMIPQRRLRMLLLTHAMRCIRAIAPGMSDLSPAVDIPSDVLEFALEIIDARLEASEFMATPAIAFANIIRIETLRLTLRANEGLTRRS